MSLQCVTSKGPLIPAAEPTLAKRLVQAVVLCNVQRLLGRKSPIMMTKRIAHHYPESLRDGVEVLDHSAAQGTNLSQLLGLPTVQGV